MRVALVAVCVAAAHRVAPADAEPAAAATTAASEDAAAAEGTNQAFVPEAKGAASEAKTAAKSAEEAAVEAEGVLASTKDAAKAAAEAAAKATFEEVKAFAAKAVVGDADGRKKKEMEAETAAAVAAAKAAEPYHAAVMRAQRLAHEYQTKAQELATAGNVLKQQAITLAGSAEHYQYTGNVVQANQIMVQAHSLFASATADQNQAAKLKASADEVAAMIPSYTLAGQAAAATAEAENAPGPEPLPEPYFLQLKRS